MTAAGVLVPRGCDEPSLPLASATPGIAASASVLASIAARRERDILTPCLLMNRSARRQPGVKDLEAARGSARLSKQCDEWCRAADLGADP